MNVIRSILVEKEVHRQAPLHALYSEIYARCPMGALDVALQQLVASGQIEEHPTIRDKSYTLK
ncbi:hypothetical protein [Rikenella microfusus]|uniref:hypothetical protein n=1 Tax=Rikenella microfusus TaxID=28139 RepID=UPI00248EF58F|nr:hypothetical protein [Rikenella microfusus]